MSHRKRNIYTGNPIFKKKKEKEKK